MENQPAWPRCRSDQRNNNKKQDKPMPNTKEVEMKLQLCLFFEMVLYTLHFQRSDYPPI